jgi:hypothetical protein
MTVQRVTPSKAISQHQRASVALPIHQAANFTAEQNPRSVMRHPPTLSRMDAGRRVNDQVLALREGDPVNEKHRFCVPKVL